MKKFLIQFVSALSIAFALIAGYIYLPQKFSSLDNKLRDYLFLYRGQIPTSELVTIVDIDERSLKELGQWPWQRHKFAKVLENLTKAEAGVIGLDIVFAEQDNSSPKKVLREMGYSDTELEGVTDFDDVLAEVIGMTPTIAGYVFAMEDDGLKTQVSPSVPAIFIERNKQEGQEFLFEPYRAILNINKIQNKAYSSGFFNTIPDDDSGIIRSVPLFMKYEGIIYPSLAFEMLRNALGENKVFVNYEDDIGINYVQVGEKYIPTDRFGRLLVNYRGPSRTFDYLSAADIYNGNFDTSSVKGKFILIGTSAPGLLDLRAIPYDNVYPGVEIHANVIDNILTEDFISKPSWSFGADVTVIILSAILLSIIFTFTQAIGSLLASVGLIFGFLYFNNYMLFVEGYTINILYPLLNIAFIFMSSLVINYFLETKQKELIKGKFANKVSPAVVDDLLKNTSDDILKGKDAEVTIFFSDIRGFTSISEAMGSASKLIEFLNEYMTPMTEIIMDKEGTVDKFIGDAIMAYWNAPREIRNHADKALSASIEQIKALKLINEQLSAEDKPLIGIGIGLNTGVATVGEMGSAGRSDYTIIGDSVNLASRVEGLNKPYGTQIIITEFTKNALKDKYIMRDLDLVRVKGKEKPVQIFEVIDYYHENKALEEELRQYNEALMLYRDSHFQEALEKFESIEGENQTLYTLYKERCEHYLKNPPVDFNGVFTFTTK